MRPLYPALDSKPLAPNQYGNAPQGSNGSQSLMDSDARPAFSAAQPSPSLELQLGPQEMQVSANHDTLDTCVTPPLSAAFFQLPGIHVNKAILLSPEVCFGRNDQQALCKLQLPTYVIINPC